MAVTDYEQLGLAELGRRLVAVGRDLGHKYIELARQEARENLEQAIRAAVWLAVGAALALFALFCFLFALVAGTAALLNWPLWLAALLWLAIFGATGGGCLLVGRRRLPLRPLERTRAELKEGMEWAKQRLTPPAS